MEGLLSPGQLSLDESSTASYSQAYYSAPRWANWGRGDRQAGHARLVHGLLFGQEGLLSPPKVQDSRGVMGNVIHPRDGQRRSLPPDPVFIDAQVIYRQGELIASCTRSIRCWTSFPTRP